MRSQLKSTRMTMVLGGVFQTQKLSIPAKPMAILVCEDSHVALTS